MFLLGNPPDCLRWLICHAGSAPKLLKDAASARCIGGTLDQPGPHIEAGHGGRRGRPVEEYERH
jgi:hypothetical protein